MLNDPLQINSQFSLILLCNAENDSIKHLQNKKDKNMIFTKCDTIAYIIIMYIIFILVYITSVNLFIILKLSEFIHHY